MRKKIAIITGGLTGIGLASARALLASGHTVALGSQRGSEDVIGNDLLESLGQEVFVHQLDVTSQTSVDEFVGKVIHDLGVPEILVNAAGIYREAYMADHADADWDDQIETNLTGPFRMIRAVMPGMIDANWGRIVNIASTAGHMGAAGYSAYSASKAGLIALGKAVSREGAPHNITCVSISPTWVETPMMDAAVLRHARQSGDTPASARAALEKSNPQGRLVQPEEIASLVAFACSDDCAALTNVDIQVNAGADW